MQGLHLLPRSHDVVPEYPRPVDEVEVDVVDDHLAQALLTRLASGLVPQGPFGSDPDLFPGQTGLLERHADFFFVAVG